MTVRDAFRLAGTVGDVLERTGVLGADGNWTPDLKPEAVIRAVAEIEAALSASGVTIPQAIDQYFRIAEAIAPMVK